jgi:hypothetical protein
MILICLLLFGCKQTSDKIDIVNDSTFLPKEIKLNDDICNFISDFIRNRNNANCIYELYIDKKTPDEYFITMFNVPNDSTYFLNHFPINYTIVAGYRIFVYSGIEDFIKKDGYVPAFKIQHEKSEQKVSYKTISKVIERDTSYIAGDIGLPFTNVKFTPPVYAPDE